jgi:hypothetical protein
MMAMEGEPRDFEFERSLPAQIEATRRLGGTGRLAMVRDLNSAVRKLMAAKVVEEHPGWTPDEVGREVVRRVLRGHH